MRYLGPVFKAKIGIRGRILSIALAPSLALLVTGAIIAGLLLIRGTDNRDWATRVDRDSAPGIEFTIQIQEERRLTLLMISGDEARRPGLAKQRAGRRRGGDHHRCRGGVHRRRSRPAERRCRERTCVGRATSDHRQRADAGTLPAAEASTYFSSIISTYIGSTELISRAAPPDTSTELAVAARLLRVAETMSRGNALATAALIRGDLTPEYQRQFAHDVGFYRSELAALSGHLPQAERSALDALTTGTSWQRLSAMEDGIADRPDLAAAGGSGSTAESQLPLKVSDWEDAATQVSVALLDLWRTHYRYALHWAQQDGARALREALVNGTTILVIAIGAFLLAARLATRLIRRLRRLRQETLTLADDHLPQITTRLRDGLPVATAEAARLDFGEDEIGQVADAFSRAQAAAIAAAVAEAKTRAGFNAVFLNIACRSQIIIHRLLAALDKAERHQEDPAQLDLLFRLDHLATRIPARAAGTGVRSEPPTRHET